MNVSEYIKSNWKNTVCTAYQKENHTLRDVDLTFTVPCMDECFVNFFYWDTYFTNIGLLVDGLAAQAKSNLEVMGYLVDKFGFVPNADHLTTRTQPPFFTRGVYDYYKATGDGEALKKFIPYIIKEQDFWDKNRKTAVGLNAYGNNEPRIGKDWYYEEFDRRLGYTPSEKQLEKYAFCDDLLAIAESGWDFNSRFQTENNRFAATAFVHLDLNSILYDAECKLAELLRIVGADAQARLYAEKAERRRDLMRKYLSDSVRGVYLDYNFKENKFSSVLSAASFYPYAFGVSTDAEGALRVYKALKLPHGISAGEKPVGTQAFQWDYPNLWPTNIYIAYLAMKNTGCAAQAEEIRRNYLAVVEENFRQTGKLWEKYNALTGGVSVTVEYDTPAMMGWTAGIYEYLSGESR